MMKFTGYCDMKGEKIYVGDYLKHRLEDVEGTVSEVGGEYVFGGCFEMVNYGADVTKVIKGRHQDGKEVTHKEDKR